MLTYTLRRTLQALPFLLLLSACLFALMRLTPGGPLAGAERNPNISKAQLQLMRARLGLDQPLPVQYFKWLGTVIVEGDLGESIKTHRPVSAMIAERVPNTVLLVGTAFLLTLLLAIPLGALAARYQYSAFDYLSTTFAFVGQSVPVFWLGLVCILVFYVGLDNPFTGKPLLPVGGLYTTGHADDWADRLWHMILPVGTLCFVWVAWYSRFLRASMLEVLNADYIRTARAKGAREPSVIYKHALRNAIIPFVTLVGLDLPSVFAGALYIETIFSWPGLGRLFWEAARGRDYPVLMGVVMINATLIVFANLLADLAYGWLDPRVRYD